MSIPFGCLTEFAPASAAEADVRLACAHCGRPKAKPEDRCEGCGSFAIGWVSPIENRKSEIENAP
jgi:rRNA maturation endonuclease Nob1